MTKWHAASIYLLLLVAIFPLASIISWYRTGGGMFDPAQLLGQAGASFLITMVTVGVAVLFSFIIGYLVRRPLRVLVWIPVGVVLAMVARSFVAPMFTGLKGPLEAGALDTFLMYLPAVALFSLLGGLLSTLMFCKKQGDACTLNDI